MEWHVTLEAHHTGANIYVAGHLAACASERAEQVIAGLHRTARVIRLDLWAVDVIDPHAFVTVVRALNRWRDATRGQLHIQFPERSVRPRRSGLRLVTSPATAAMTLPPPITIFEKPAAGSAAW